MTAGGRAAPYACLQPPLQGSRVAGRVVALLVGRQACSSTRVVLVRIGVLKDSFNRLCFCVFAGRGWVYQSLIYIFRVLLYVSHPLIAFVRSFVIHFVTHGAI